MKASTVWPARRVKDRILCGRPAPDGGCRGEIAHVYISGHWMAYVDLRSRRRHRPKVVALHKKVVAGAVGGPDDGQEPIR